MQPSDAGDAAPPDAAPADASATDAPAGDAATDAPVQGDYRFTQLAGVTSPFVGRWGFAVADKGDGTAVVFAGADFDSAGSGMPYNEAYLVDARGETPTFTRIDAPMPPAARWCVCATFDTRRNRVVVFGGRGGATGTPLPQTWVLDLAANTWTQAMSASGPTYPIGCSMAYAPNRDAVYLFGGGNESAVTNEMWRFDPTATSWTRVMTATSPSTRYDAEFRYVPERSGMVLFGGGRGGRFPTDVWTFDPMSEAWSQITVAGDAMPPGRRTPWLRVEPGGTGFVVGYGTTTLQGTEMLSDLWRFDFASASWRDITPPLASIPDPRGFALSLPAGHGHIGLMVGGFDASAARQEVWRIDAPVGDTRW